jgi:hypothetical protein
MVGILVIDALCLKTIILSRCKVYFRPVHLEDSVVTAKVPPLPVGETVVEVFADFLRYILECARTYITESYPNGQSVWESVEDEIEFVLTHPNGYEGHQQEQLRQAAVLAGLVPDENAARARVALGHGRRSWSPFLYR